MNFAESISLSLKWKKMKNVTLPLINWIEIESRIENKRILEIDL